MDVVCDLAASASSSLDRADVAGSSTIGSLPLTPPHTDPFARSSSLTSLDASTIDATTSAVQLDPYLLTRLSLDFDVDPPIPWPAESSTSNTETGGGRGWDVQMDLSSSPSTQPDLEAWARAQYLEALCMPETIYPLAHLVPTLQRLTPPPPPSQPTAASPTETSYSAPTPAPSPLLPLVTPLPLLSQKYRRRLPLLLPLLLSTSTTAVRPPSLGAEGIDELEWKALRAGLAIWVGTRSSAGSSTGPRSAETPGRTEEEQVEKVRQDQIREEDRLLSDGKKWLEGMERRETLLQIILLLLLPPAVLPTASSTTSTKRPRKQKSSAGSSRIDIPKAFDQLTDRLSVWQALGTLGVDVAKEERDREQTREKKGKGKERSHDGGRMGGEVGLGRQDDDERDWVGRFCENVVEKNFAATHPKLVLSFHLKALPLVPPPPSLAVRPTPSRSRSSASKPNPAAHTTSHPTSTSTNPPIFPSKSRTKVLARQLPSNANARDLSQPPPPVSSSRAKSVSSSRALFPGSTAGSSSSSAAALKRTTSSATVLAATSSFGGGSGGSRRTSMGPTPAETKTEKLMRRSVSFTRGSSVSASTSSGGLAGRRLAAVGEGSQSQSSLIAAAAAGGPGSRTTHPPVTGLARARKTSLDSHTVSNPKPLAPTVAVASVSTGMSQAKSQPLASKRTTSTTLVQTTPSKPKANQKVLVPETPNHHPSPGPLPDFMAETPPSKAVGSGSGMGGGGRRLFGLSASGGGGGIREESEMDEERDSLRELFVDGTDDEDSGSDDEMRL